jgi:hypothetical protein
MRERAAKANWARTVFALVTIAAWFCLSNHCALGLALSAPEADTTAETGGCPMHSAPVKKDPAPKTPCCKGIRAVVAKVVKTAGNPARTIRTHTFAAYAVVPPSRFPTVVELLDTGPPHSISFAESVLQESMLAHAPPSVS